jgi:hypothetical protein
VRPLHDKVPAASLVRDEIWIAQLANDSVAIDIDKI